QPMDAERAFDQALKLDASNVAGQVGAARLAASKRDFTLALSRVEQALSGAPSNVQALLLKADLLGAQAKPDEAETAYRAAIDAAPNQTAPRLAFITHLLRQRAVEKASVEVAAMEKAAPKDPATSYANAMVLSEEKNFPAAKEAILHV